MFNVSISLSSLPFSALVCLLSLCSLTFQAQKYPPNEVLGFNFYLVMSCHGGDTRPGATPLQVQHHRYGVQDDDHT